MANFLTVSEVDVKGKAVLVRADLEWEGSQSPRELTTKGIVGYLLERGAARVKVVGHKGNISQVEELGVDVYFEVRSDAREEQNSEEFAAELGREFDIYVNEAFATSHRNHTSIVALPKWMRSQGKTVCAGMRFAKEIEVLVDEMEKVSKDKRVLVIGGAKAGDKAKYAQLLQEKFDQVLKGGLLPGVDLREDGLDISEKAIEEYEEKIAGAELVVVAGPMGKYEDDTAHEGTRRVFEAVANSKAYKIAGGGDTEAALEKFGVKENMNWISVGGGAMLEYLATGTLPGIQSLYSK